MLLAISVLLVASSAAQGSSCCNKVQTLRSCRSACEKLHQDTATDLETTQQRLLDVRNFCPQYLVPFWKCMNQTEEGFGGGGGGEGDEERSGGWSSCCEEATTERCRRGCRQSLSPSQLHHHCRRSDEIEFFSCIQKQEAGEECCGLARSPDCHERCRRWLRGPGKVPWSLITAVCTPSVQSCLNNISKPVLLASPQKYLHCCEEASSAVCRETCRRNLHKKMYEVEIMSSLKEACGPLLLHEGETKLAECLLRTEPVSALRRPAQTQAGDSLGFEPALLHCCSKALDLSCGKLCNRAFFNNSASPIDFEKYCPYSTEENLLQCNDEVLEPCELGCDDLSFCSELNGRPTELFRSCNRRADEAARRDLASFSKGYLTLPNKEKLYVTDLVQCPAERFKALACLNQIKPCHRLTQTIRVCLEDCMQLMGECINFNKSKAFESATKLCRLLSPAVEGSPCLRLESFESQPSPEPASGAELESQKSILEVTSPCKASICASDEICLVNRSCADPNECAMYVCVKGCEIGKSQSFLIPEKTYARGMKAGKGVCHSICQCTRQGVLRHCRETCKPKGSGCKGFEHGSTYYRGCNLCSCNHGEVVCSKKLCNVTSQNATTIFTTLPCKCQPHYLPVCGWNGQTYPNECLAKCAGIGTNYTIGACSSLDPCKYVRCQRKDEVCLRKRQVCLAELHKNCSQHVCVRYSPKVDCPHYVDDPVCDTEGVTHASPCKLLKARKELAYFGPCLAHCVREGEVCGVDGNTYESECAAAARYVQVDYPGNCTQLGSVQLEPGVQCQDVYCPWLSAADCLAFTPPGACCPVCAGAFTALFSQKEVERVLFAFNGIHGMEQLTVEAVMSTLDREVKTAECHLRGQLTIEHDLLVLVVPTRRKLESPLVREACVREAEKLAVLIQRGSPRLMVPLSSSVLTAARLVHQRLRGQDPDTGLPSTRPVPALLALASLTLLSAYLRV